MIAKFGAAGRTPKRLLDYLAGPGREDSRLLLTNLHGTEPAEWAQQIEAVSRQFRPRLTDFVRHIVVGFPPGERPDDEDVQAMARFYLDGMGFSEAPHVVVMHEDRRHLHLHIVTTPTTWTGEKVKESWNWRRSERLMREIEIRWNLQRVKPSHEARARSLATGERRRAEATGEISARTVFQVEITETARQSKTLLEFVERLHQRGYEVRAHLDRSGTLRGISFAKGGQQFKGSQLGQSFKGARILERFQLRYEPARDRERLERALQARAEVSPTSAAASTERERLAALLRERLRSLDIEIATNEARGSRDQALRSRLDGERATVRADLERLERGEVRAVRDLSSYSTPSRTVPIPAGTYQLATVDRTHLENRKPLDTREGLLETTRAVSHDQIYREVERLKGGRQDVEILIRPSLRDFEVIGFRGVTAEQLDALRRDALEPSWIVARGDRHDIQIRTPDRWSEHERYNLARATAEHYGIEPSHGLWAYATRLPIEDPPRDDPHAPRLIAANFEKPANEQPFRQLLPETHEQRAIERTLDDLSFHDVTARTPALALEARLHEWPSLGRASVINELQREVESVRRVSPDTVQRDGSSDEALFHQAREANAAVLRELGGARTLDAASPATLPDLLRLEAEIANRWQDAIRQLTVTEERLNAERNKLESLLARAQREPESVPPPTYYRHLLTAHEIDERHQGIEGRALSYLYAQVNLDRDRYLAAMAGGRVMGEQIEGLAALTRTAARLEVSLESLRGQAREPQPSRLELRQQLLGLQKENLFLREQVRQEPARALPLLDANERHLARVELAVARAGQHAPVESASSALSRLSGSVARLETMSTSLARTDHGPQSPALDSSPAAQSENDPLRQAITRVARGDLSPVSLQGLNRQIVASIQHDLLPLPIRPSEGISFDRTRTERLYDSVQRLAQRMANSEREPSSHALARLYQRNLEVLSRFEEALRAVREHRGLPGPPIASRGALPSTAQFAWFANAVRQGLEPRSLSDHLRLQASAFATGLGEAAVRTAARVTFALSTDLARRLARHIDNVLHQ